MAQANVVNTLVVPAQTKVAPYYDDFDESKNFHRITFRPGYAVQARELTQIQTIMQNQIERFGRHIFVNGSSVIGGKLDVTDSITINLAPTYANSDIDINNFRDKTVVVKDSSGISYTSARVLQVSESSNTAPAALHVKYITGAEFSPGDTIQVDGTAVYANIAPTSNAITESALSFIYDSIYFMEGYFIKVPQQVIVLSKHDRQANARVGLEVVDAIVTEQSDISLLDPALEASNYQAPGAGRYQVELVLNKRSLDSTDDERFIQVARVENGAIKELVKNPIYSEIEEVLARRTYDESGNYTTKPFNALVETSTIDPSNNFTLIISPGKAYLYGYEVESQAETRIEVPAARATYNVNNYGLNMTYGNYVIVDNLKGYFNTTSLVPTDMHCVTANLINYANTTTYNSSKIGTARIRDLNFYGGDTDVNARKYELYFIDQKFRTITGNVSALIANTYQINLNSANTSAANDAYVGAYIKIATGNAAGDLRIVTAYNGVTKIANVTPAFSASPETSTPFEIRFDMTDVDSFVANVAYTPNTAINASASVSTVSKDDSLMTGNTIVSDTTLVNSLWQYPDQYIAPGITDQSYVYRRVYSSVAFTAGNSTPITAGTDEEFMGSTTTSNTDLSVMSNFLVIVTDKTGSSRNVGDQVKVTSTISTSLPEQAILYTANTSESFTGTVYAKIRAAGSAAQHRVKSLVLGNNTVLSSASPDGQFTNPTGSNTKVYLTAGQVVITDFSPNTAESLFISDVIGAKTIYGTNEAPTAGMDLTDLDDISLKFTLETGHRNAYYDHASLSLKPGITNTHKYVIAVLRYFSSTSDVGYFSIDSYPNLANTVYDDGVNIGTGYTFLPVLGGMRLGDCIDFRPIRPNASNNENFLFNTVRTPVSGEDFTSDYKHYLERRDIVTLSLNDSIQLTQGEPARKPNFPPTPYRNLLTHQLRVLPYTESNTSVMVKALDYRRYTMDDISSIDKRLKVVEYTTSLNALEKQATDISIPDVNGLDRTKYGILAENFTSYLLADKTAPDFSCAIDINGTFTSQPGAMMPRPFVGNVKLGANSAIGVSKHNERYTLSYTTKPLVSQNVASKILPVTDYLFSDFRGQMVTLPDADVWKYDPPVVPPVDPRRPDEPTYPGGLPTTTSYDNRLLYSAGAPNGGLGSIYYNKTTGEWVSNYGSGDVTTLTGGDAYNASTAAMTETQYNAFITDMAKNSGRLTAEQAALVTPAMVAEVTSYYNSQLNRDPDAPGLAYWVAEAAATGSRTFAGSGLTKSFDSAMEKTYNVTTNINPTVAVTYGGGTATTTTITTTYTQQSGTGSNGLYEQPLANRGDLAATGTSVTTVDTTPGTATQQLVASMYKDVLGRGADQAGFDYWVQQVNSGLSKTDLQSAFQNSAEAQAKAGK